MLFLFLLGLWGGHAGAPPAFKPIWAAAQTTKPVGPLDTP